MSTAAKKPLPRRQVAPFVALLAREMPAGIVSGSWRRGSAEVADLDVVLPKRSGVLTAADLPASFAATQALGAKLARGELVLGRRRLRCDIWVCRPAELGAFLAYTTGPGNLAIRMRSRARAQGMVLNQYGLWRDGKRVRGTATERGIFTALGLRWAEPEEREPWARPGRGAVTMVIPSRSGGEPHRVRIEGAREECSCTGWRFRRQPCWAIREARARLARKESA